MSSVKILIADDHEPVRRGLRSLVEARPGWNVCGEVADGKAAVAAARKLRPNLILLDVTMPEMSGLDAAQLIRVEVPDCRILIVSQNEPALMKKEAERVGAHGFISKSKISEDLVLMIEAIVNSPENL
jgi:DNA-binding NarL/FixJ family response regulator